ncbi:MAG: choice-of-anchor Q domain-containing protein [Fibrobacterota bacterium]
MRRKTGIKPAAIFTIIGMVYLNAMAASYYVDATNGSNTNTGLSPATAWKTIDKVNGSALVAGDSVLFKKGETFRGSLIPCSGSSSGYITYGAYGTGNKPKLLASYQRNSPSDWAGEGGNIWKTSYQPVNMVGEELLPNPSFDTDLSAWSKYDNSSNSASSVFSRTTVAGEYVTSPGGGKLECANHGSGLSDIQIYTSSWSISALKWYKLSFKAKSTLQFTFAPNGISLSKAGSPWTSYYSASSPQSLSITADWATYVIYYKVNATAADSRITFYAGGTIPNGAIFYLDSLSFMECDGDIEPLNVDVGNIIFNNEAFCGIKVWNETDLNAQGTFWYDEDNDLLKTYSVSNPASYYSHIELGMRYFCIYQSNRSYVIYENLDLRYGCFGIAGSNTHHIWVKDMDISFIGGGDQYGGTKTVRLGNGIEFWNAAHDNIVERCTFNQIYDAALTAQGKDSSGFEVYNLYFRNNLINNCEYSFEYWERYDSSKAHDIYFENNTCLNAGGGWGHSQRPDPNGTHLMFFSNNAQTDRVYVRNNIFCNSTEQGVRWSRLVDVNKVILEHNCWHESSGPIAKVVNTYYDYATQWASYKIETGQDSNSIAGDPQFNIGHSLAGNSPCIDAGMTLATVTDDYNNASRPQGDGYDIGAFEYSVSTQLQYPRSLSGKSSLELSILNRNDGGGKIIYAIPENALVKIALFNILGKNVKTLVNDYRIAGTYQASFRKTQLANGLYFCVMKVNSATVAKKLFIGN